MHWKPIALVATLIAFGFVAAPASRVWGGCPRATVTFDHDVTLPAGVVLRAGEYTFQIADMPDLVLVRSADCQDTFCGLWTGAGWRADADRRVVSGG